MTGTNLFGSAPGALVGTQLVSRFIATHAEHADALLTHALGIMLLLAASASLFRAIGYTWEQPTAMDPGPISTALLGFIIGLLVGATSIGAGSLLMAAFALFYKQLSPSQALPCRKHQSEPLPPLFGIAYFSRFTSFYI